MSKHPKKIKFEWQDDDTDAQKKIVDDPYGSMTDSHKFHGAQKSSKSSAPSKSSGIAQFARAAGLRLEGKQAILDLHQLVLSDAMDRVERTLQDLIADGRIKNIRVITGRGNHSEGGGVLAREIQPYVASRFAKHITRITDSPHKTTLGGHPARGHFDVTLK